MHRPSFSSIVQKLYAWPENFPFSPVITWQPVVPYCVILTTLIKIYMQVHHWCSVRNVDRVQCKMVNNLPLGQLETISSEMQDMRIYIWRYECICTLLIDSKLWRFFRSLSQFHWCMPNILTTFLRIGYITTKPQRANVQKYYARKLWTRSKCIFHILTLLFEGHGWKTREKNVLYI